MNELDAVTIILIVVALILGWRSGALPQITGLLGAVAGGVAAIVALPALADPLSGIDPTFRPIVVLGGLVGAVAIGESIGAAVGRLYRSSPNCTWPGLSSSARAIRARCSRLSLIHI